MEKHEGVAANAGHGVLTAMIAYTPKHYPTSLMICLDRPTKSMQMLQGGGAEEEGGRCCRCGETGRQSCIQRLGRNRKPAFAQQPVFDMKPVPGPQGICIAVVVPRMTNVENCITKSQFARRTYLTENCRWLAKRSASAFGQKGRGNSGQAG
jgi:hypothetical protein